MRAVILAFVIAGFVSCKSPSVPDPTSRVELDSELQRVLAVGIPSAASDVEGQVKTLMTHVVDVEFTCDRPTLEAFWDSAPKLAAVCDGASVSTDPAESAPDFDDSWSSGSGTQFCSVVARATPSGEIRVVIRMTHE